MAEAFHGAQALSSAAVPFLYHLVFHLFPWSMFSFRVLIYTAVCNLRSICFPYLFSYFYQAFYRSISFSLNAISK